MRTLEAFDAEFGLGRAAYSKASSKFGLLAPQHDHYGSDHYQDDAWINGIKGRPFRANIDSPHLATIENMTDYQRNTDDSQYNQNRRSREPFD
jgi:hypothetical protein